MLGKYHADELGVDLYTVLYNLPTGDLGKVRYHPCEIIYLCLQILHDSTTETMVQ